MRKGSDVLGNPVVAFDTGDRLQTIKGAAGRPVNRVILDPQDKIILNVGEIITFKAINEARQADVLDVLLNSVHKADPGITSQELRAPEPGRASLEEAKNET